MRTVPSLRRSRETRYAVAACSTALVLSSVTSSIAVQPRSSLPHAARVSSTQRRATAIVATSGANDCSAVASPVAPNSVTRVPSAARSGLRRPEGNGHRDRSGPEKHAGPPRVAEIRPCCEIGRVGRRRSTSHSFSTTEAAVGLLDRPDSPLLIVILAACVVGLLALAATTLIPSLRGRGPRLGRALADAYPSERRTPPVDVADRL